MTHEEIEARKAEINEILNGGGEFDLDALEEEVRSLNEQDEQLKRAAALEAETRAAVAAGAGTVMKTFEETEEKRNMFDVNSAEYREAWLKDLQGVQVTPEERTALANGGYVIPQETANKIWGKMELYPLLNAVDVMHVPGTVILPVEGTVNDAAVVAMGTAATDSADTMAQVSLGIYKIIKTIEITADVAAMAIPAFETWLVERLANKMYRKVTSLIASGTGSSTVTGLKTITATGNTYTSTGVTYADLLAIIAKLPSQYLPNAKFVMSRATFWGGVKALKTDNDVRVVNTDVGSPAAYNILGFPVIIEDDISTDIVFGDLKEGYVFNFGKGIAVDRDESVGFRAGSVVYRGMCLGDGKPTGVGLVRYTKAT